MKIVKILAILAAVYVLIVVAFESLLGYLQPAGANSLVITTTDADGNKNDRVLSRIDLNGHLYVAANHWPRAWYKAALANPEVQITIDGEKADYVAVPVSDEEHARVDEARRLGIVIRLLTGFPPRYFVRLDPVTAPRVEDLETT